MIYLRPKQIKQVRKVCNPLPTDEGLPQLAPAVHRGSDVVPLLVHPAAGAGDALPIPPIPQLTSVLRLAVLLGTMPNSATPAVPCAAAPPVLNDRARLCDG